MLPAVALLLPLSLLAISSWMGWQVAEREVRREMARTADAAAEYVGRVLAGYRFALSRAVDLVRDMPDAEITAQEGALHAELRRLLSELPQAEAAYVTDRHGFPLLGASVYPVPRGVATAADRSFFLSLSGPNPPDLHVSEVYRSRIDGIPFFALSRRRMGGDEGASPDGFTGVVNVSVSPELIGVSLRHFLSSPGDAISLIKLDGAMLARTAIPPGGLPTATRTVAENFQQSMEPDVHSMTDGERQVLARRRVAGFPLLIAARRSRADMVAKWRHDQMAQWAVGLPAMLALFLLSLRVRRDGTKLARTNTNLGMALTESEAWLKRATEGAGIGTWEYDPVSRCFTGSAQWHRLWGFDPAMGPTPREALLARVSPEFREAMHAILVTAWESGQGRLEYAIHRPRDGQPAEIVWRVKEAHRLPGVGGRGETLVGISYDITKRRLAEERASRLLHHLVEAQASERLRIARDLHDCLGQHLALLHLELATLAREGVPQGGPVRLVAIADELGRDVSRLAHDMRPTAIDDLGLDAAIRQMVEQWGRRTGLETELILQLPAKRLPMPVETTLYRIVQEALTNILKHAQAERVGVVIASDTHNLKMVIEDNGRGMDEMILQGGSKRLGLRGISEQLELLGGNLEVESSPGVGTALLIEMPL